MSNSTTTSQVLTALERSGFSITKSGAGWKSRCPNHSGKSQSLSIDNGDNGAVLLHCFSGCTFENVLHSLGLDQANGAKRIVATYDYDGKFETVKYSPKGFKQRRKTASGEWAWNLKGVALRLYRQDDLMAAGAAEVYVVEGEKDVETLRQHDLLAVTNHGGAGKWRKAHTAALVAAGCTSVTIFPDDDEAGRKHGEQVAASCKAAGLAVKVCELPAKDVSAFLDVNGDKAALLALATAAAEWTPQPKSNTSIDVLTQADSATAGATFDRKDASTLETVFEQLGWQTRHNLRSMRCEWSVDSGTTWASTTDRMEKKFRRTIAETYSYHCTRDGKKAIRPLVFGRDAWDEFTGAILADHEVDPFRLWLEEALPRWDGVRRLHRLLTDMFKAEDSPLTRWASTALLLGPVQRCFEPGCKLDEIVILVGGQGIGKSTLLSHLLPQTQPDWFSDSLTMSDNLQKMVEALQGRVVCELSDLQGFRKADMQSLKAFITRRDDGSVRLSFRRNPETALRRCVLVGTADRLECLPNDSAGLRRFVPVVCPKGTNVESFMAAHRLQLWSEALSQYRESNGATRANLPRSLMTVQTERAEDHRRKDEVVEDSVADITGDGYTMLQLCQRTNPTTDPSDRKALGRLGDALRLAGWVKRRERDDDGKLVYLWRRGGGA